MTVLFVLTIICSMGMINLFLCSSFADPLTLVGNTAVKATQVVIKPAHVLKGCKKNKKKHNKARKSHYHLGIVLRLSHHHSLMAFDYVLLSAQGSSLTVMSSMAINPSLMVFRWAVIISCGWIFTFLSYTESMRVLSLNAYSICYLNIWSRKKAVDICIVDKTAILEVILFVLQVYFQYF